MATIREQILRSVKTLLEGTGKPTGLTVHRQRSRPLEQDDLPAIVVYPLSDDADDADHDLAEDHTLTVALEMRVKVSATESAAGKSSDEVLDPLYTWSVSKMLADITQGGLAIDTREGSTTWDVEEPNVVLGRCATTFEIDYLTEAANPETTP